VVGLGAGALAALAQPGDTWTFLEIDPVVVRLARDAKYFTYLRDSPARVDVVVGDARLSLAKMGGPFDVIVLDAFSSDAVPVHLLTREALQLYLARLKPGGVLAFHASSRFLRLRPVFAGLAKDAGLADLREFDKRDERRSDWSGWTPSEWVLMARSRADFGGLTDDTRWGPIEDEPARVWTDDYANVMAAFRWR
jgi:SAM-dependent methyltransferase